MQFSRIFLSLVLVSSAALLVAQDSSSTAPKHTRKPSARAALDPGTVTANVYRNKTLGLSYKIPEGWVLRTDEMNEREEVNSETASTSTASSPEAQVLLATFSRPPAARGEDINSSVLIAAESQAAYPGLKEAVQYLGPLGEVAKAQGFAADDEPSDLDIGSKTLIRADYHKDVGKRVMHQSTLAMLSHGYAISITIIGGTDDEVDELIENLSFAAAAK